MEQHNNNNTPKRVAALIGIALLVALYLVTLCLAIFGNENTTPWFMACIIATLVVPVLIWVYLWFYKMLKKDVDDAREKAIREQEARDAHDMQNKPDDRDSHDDLNDQEERP